MNLAIQKEGSDPMSENQAVEPGYARPDDSLNKRVWFRMLPLEQRTLLGTVFFFIVLLTMGWVGLNESNRMTAYDNQYNARAIQRGAAIFDSTCAPCHGKRGEGTSGVAPTLNKPEEFNGTRLKELNYQGSLRDYMTLTISAGRPARSNPEWPQPMPTWSQDYGGPLRPDQIQDVVSFVMNWGCAYDAKYDAICMGQDTAYNPGALPTEGPTPTAAPTTPPISIADVIAKLPKGDPARGEAIYKGTAPLSDGNPAGCNACHTVDGAPLVGPSFKGLAATIPPAEWPVPADVKDKNIDPKVYYLAESIYNPDAFKVKGFESAQMLKTFSTRMSKDGQDLADVIAWLQTQ
jgi:mono/diheme cytochrome c family protein